MILINLGFLGTPFEDLEKYLFDYVHGNEDQQSAKG